VVNNPANLIDPLGLGCAFYVQLYTWNDGWHPAGVEGYFCDSGQRVGDEKEIKERDTKERKPKPPSIIAAVNRCAAQNAASATSLLNIKRGGLLDTFVTGNNAAAISTLVFGTGDLRKLNAAAGVSVFGPQPQNLVNATAGVVAQVPTGSLVTQTESLGAGVGTITRTTEQVVGQTTAGTISAAVAAVFTGKFAFLDAPAYLNALYGCATGSLMPQVP